jgi:hypothetical protein
MQPRYAAYEAAVADGDIPVAGMAQLFVEVAPANEVYDLVDKALKATPVRVGSQVVEREFGFVELHSESTKVVEEAGRVILDQIGTDVEGRLRPRVVSQKLIVNLTPFQAQLINRFRKGSLVIPEQTLLVLEIAPAAYVLLAANEAEKSAGIDVIDVRPVGRFGRLFISGAESEVREAQAAVVAALAALPGREAE